MGSIFQTDTIQQEQNNLHNMENFFDPNIEQEEQIENKQPIQSYNSQPIKDMITLLKNNIWLVWLGIAFILLIRKITMYQSFVRYVKAGQILISDIELLDKLSVLVQQSGIKKPVELCINPLISSPLLIGFFRPYIVLPSIDISEKDFRYTMLHELTHFKRWDMFFKWFVQVTVCLHWFNPLVYLMSREINKACEFSCDEAIIAKLEYSNIQEYGKTLLDSMAKYRNYKESLASFMLSENKKILKERLVAIMHFKKKSKVTAAITFTLTIALICGASYIGAYAAKNSSVNTMTEQTAKDYSKIINKPGTKLHRIDMWSGSASETTRQDGIVEVNLKNFIGDRTNYEFEAEYNDTIVLHLNSSLSGDYEILFTREENATILEAIPAFTGSKEVVLKGLPKGTISLIVYSKNASGKLEIKKVSVKHLTADSSNTSTPSNTKQTYTYSQSGFYQGSYVFELGWNLDKKSYNAYPDKAKLTLSDLTTITISFDKSCKNEAKDSAVLKDLKALIERLKPYSKKPLKYPLVVSVKYTGNNELIELADEYYTNGELTRFSAIFSFLDNDVQKVYCNKMIEDNKLTFFSSCAEYLDTDMAEYFAKKAYEKEKLTFFSSIAPYLTRKQKQKWAAIASKDNKNTFLSVLNEKKKSSWY